MTEADLKRRVLFLDLGAGYIMMFSLRVFIAGVFMCTFLYVCCSSIKCKKKHSKNILQSFRRLHLRM